jgi:hypothetical protein
MMAASSMAVPHLQDEVILLIPAQCGTGATPDPESSGSVLTFTLKVKPTEFIHLPGDSIKSGLSV